MQWVLCPCCQKKTRVQIRADTVLFHFPLHCPKCGKVSLVDIASRKVTVVQTD